jgi:hypothetical protein
MVASNYITISIPIYLTPDSLIQNEKDPDRLEALNKVFRQGSIDEVDIDKARESACRQAIILLEQKEYGTPVVTDCCISEVIE